jgi:hypothetical protein
MHISSRRRTVSRVLACLALSTGMAGCLPRLHLPDVGPTIPGWQNPADSASQLARLLAPVLYIQRDEPFPLLRTVAVVHPTRHIVAYYLLWKHDVNGQWNPFAKPSDEEEVWVGYDPATQAPTDMWTYWHGTLLHTEWRDRGMPAVDVQWGKHGSLPRGIIESDLPPLRTLNTFYALEFALLPDILIGKLVHGGPWGFFHSYGRYRDFTTVDSLAGHLDAIVMAADPAPSLAAVFGSRYSRKIPWPPMADHDAIH